MIDKPGFFYDMTANDYHADPCPAPSLSQSVAKIILDRSPLHAWYAHPRLNPDYQHDDDRKFDVGNVAHKILIGRGKELVVLDHDDWRTKAAKEAREAAAAQGKLAVLGKHYAKAARMVEAARFELKQRDLPALFDTGFGDGEVVIAWQEGDLWFRQMIDWLTKVPVLFADYKTTGESAAPHALARKMAADGWHVQAAMAERGLDVLDPAHAGRRRFLFIVQEDERPYALNVVELGEGPLTMGRKMLHAASIVWGQCMKANWWPGYPTEIIVPEFPGWAESAWLDREQIEFESTFTAQKPSKLVADILNAG